MNYQLKTLVDTLANTFANNVLDGDKPDKLCFVVSYPLYLLLLLNGVDVKVSSGHVDLKANAPDSPGLPHYWLLHRPSGKIIDATYQQVAPEGPQVYIGEKPDNFRVQQNSPPIDKALIQFIRPLLITAEDVERGVTPYQALSPENLERYLVRTFRAAYFLWQGSYQMNSKRSDTMNYQVYFDEIQKLLINHESSTVFNKLKLPAEFFVFREWLPINSSSKSST